MFLPLLIHLFYSCSQDKPWTSAESGKGDLFESILFSLQSFAVDLYFFLETMCYNIYEPTKLN